MERAAQKTRAAVAWLLMAVETVITLPIFTVSWLVSSIGLAALGGFRFAKLESSEDKMAVLMKALGEKGKK